MNEIRCGNCRHKLAESEYIRLANRIDVALNDAKDWLRYSPTVMMVAGILPLAEEQLDALFSWANARVGTV